MVPAKDSFIGIVSLRGLYLHSSRQWLVINRGAHHNFRGSPWSSQYRQPHFLVHELFCCFFILHQFWTCTIDISDRLTPSTSPVNSNAMGWLFLYRGSAFVMSGGNLGSEISPPLAIGGSACGRDAEAGAGRCTRVDEGFHSIFNMSSVVAKDSADPRMNSALYSSLVDTIVSTWGNESGLQDNTTLRAQQVWSRGWTGGVAKAITRAVKPRVRSLKRDGSQIVSISALRHYHWL